ncbi:MULTISPECIES: recombinase family protein [Mycobacterium]|uniref:Site-specific recombinase DNA invertase Pin n=1 Tax=Mycobacterium kiyosense TaxID=2871094 RepID=A0A9P3QCF8_9MYCO|nr:MULTISPECIES: recombinase family protein [Mycobacterium]BDB42843.1 site-specific recombinase DNA invertase Pin [Mycobacterium kiyosense]BDE13918.1 site-specific recombinase DNA invertase Pin [Mycobacterium sp. 20KCMC460]GLB84630.1 site-specific recombinase DNA invertase Pin [Mycobacterium kiyosense]GLB91919.1 site-specific recombinase DNA invertase Pin [Mycobacterium kiyosense]GLB97978.1 site-specific recombinase DNA invertase Pin [Mycobacterium kiyosense]
MNTSVGERVALYARISQDTSGQAVGVTAQLDHARTFASARGYRIVAEHTDNDISAFRGAERPGYQKVLRLARDRQIDRVIVYQLTRMTRNRGERAEFIDSFHACRVNVSEAQGGDYDLSTAAGRSWVDIQGALATWESEIKSERVTAAAARRARSGRPSSDLGYGWQKRGRGADATWVEHPQQAGVVREVVDRLLAGDTLRGITESLNQRGEPAPNSARWGKTSVKKLAIRESNIAQRVHHRGLPDEERFDGCWPPIVDRAKHEKVVALLTEPGRRVNGTARPGARRHLLSWGIGECGVCGEKLRAVTRRGQRGKPLDLYICDSNKGCVGRSEPSVDEVVREVVIARLAQPDALDWLLGDDAEARRWSDRARELNQRLSEAADAFAEGAISADQLRRITARLQPELDEAERRRAESVVSLDISAVQPLAGPRARERWDEMAVSQRRAILQALRLRVIIDRTRPGPGFDPSSVRFEWDR